MRKTIQPDRPQVQGLIAAATGDRGHGDVGMGGGVQPSIVRIGSPAEVKLELIPTGWDVLDTEGAIRTEIHRVLPLTHVVGLALGGLVETLEPGSLSARM